MNEWNSKSSYSCWFKCKDYYSGKKINSFDINSFGYKHDIINSMNDSITKNLYGNFHYFVNINDSFPDKSLINVCLGCATLRNLIIPNDNDNFIDSIEISNDIVNNNQHTTFKYRDFYFVDLNDVVPTRIMTVGVDEDLISNYLGFLEGYHNVTRTAIDNAADIIDDVEINLCLFKKIGKLGRNLEWQVPTDYNRVLEEVLYERRGYLEIIPSMVFPFELRRPWIDGAIDGRTRPPYIWLFLGAP
jgi:hypothetical protein